MSLTNKVFSKWSLNFSIYKIIENYYPLVSTHQRIIYNIQRIKRIKRIISSLLTAATLYPASLLIGSNVSIKLLYLLQNFLSTDRFYHNKAICIISRNRLVLPASEGAHINILKHLSGMNL